MSHSLYQTIFLEDRPLLDVRAPCEYQKGAFAHSVNCPILDDRQREQVGLCYKENGQQQAIELGHQLITPKIKEQLVLQWTTFAASNPHGFLYCFRGGKRSQFAQSWLRDHGIEYPLVPGGYKQMRNYLLDQLELHANTLPLVLVSGKTGSGKTELLPKLPCHIDLEALANHRGSSFGAVLTPQPTTINFENNLSVELLKLASVHPTTIYLEDEGKLIGRLAVPQPLRERMLHLPCVLLEESIDTRICVSEKDYISGLLNRYCDQHGSDKGTTLFVDHHKKALQKISKRFGTEQVNQAEAAFDHGMHCYLKDRHTKGFYEYIKILLLHYYDPMYEYQFNSKNRKVLFKGTADDIIQWCHTHYQQSI